MTDKWWDYFSVRRIGKTYYVAFKHRMTPISPDFPTGSAAKRWIKECWKDIMVEEIVLKGTYGN